MKPKAKFQFVGLLIDRRHLALFVLVVSENILKKIKIIYPMASKQKSNITKFLSLQGISTIKYNIISEKQFSISGIKELKCDRVKHSNLESFALKIIYKDGHYFLFMGFISYYCSIY